MSKKRLGSYFLISITVGLLLTACAGYASGRFEAGSTTLAGWPAVQLWQAPLFETVQPAGETADTLPLARPLAMVAHQALTQTPLQAAGGLCHRP